MGSYSNFQTNQQKNKNNKDMTKRPMQITKKEELDVEFEDKIIDWTTFYR